MPEAIIIGAGPAGSIAAIYLAKNGFRVSILEQHLFPRDKVCGECLSSSGINVLNRLGLMPKIARFAPAILTRTILHASRDVFLEVPLPQPMWGLSRRAMDATLFQAALDAGAVARQPARCERVESGRPPVVRWRCLNTNQLHEERPDWVVIADGKGALPAPPPTATGDLGIKAHFAGVDGPRDAVELFGFQGHYGGLAAIEDGRWNIAFSVPITRLRAHGGNIDAVFHQMMRENDALATRLHPAKQISPWLASPLPRFAIKPKFPARTIPVGNAAAALEPIGGEGMGLAMRSAELAAKALLRWTDQGDESSLQLLPSMFDELWQTRSLACRLIARLFSAPTLADAAIQLAASSGSLPSAVLRWVGKR